MEIKSADPEPSSMDSGRRNKGMGLLEVMIAMTVLTIALVATSSLFFSATTLSNAANAKQRAYEAARNKVEELRNETFSNIYAKYKNGGTTGNTFTVIGLSASGTTPVGQIIFPESTVATITTLRETTVNAELGMPRDLNGDGSTNADDRALDYTLLPFQILITWDENGEKTFKMTAQLVDK